jgi:hypothetical protein
MGNLYGNIGTSTPTSLLADPIGAIRKTIAVTLGHGDLTRGTVMVRNATSGLYEPATADTLIAGSIAVVLADDVATGTATAGTAQAATAWFRGRFLRGKVKLAAGVLPAAKYGVLNGMGIMLEEFIPGAGAETTFNNVIPPSGG